VPGQLIPPVPVTVPDPVPATLTLRVRWVVVAVNVAVTLLSALIVKLHVPVPEQAPLQPAKVEPGLGLAVSVTGVPSA
jgi:hypothetical protein